MEIDTVSSKFKIRTKDNKVPELDNPENEHWTEPFYFVQGADCQFGMMADFGGDDPGKWDAEIKLTRKTIGLLNNMQPKPKFFVICGDLTNADVATELEMKMRQESDLKEVLAELDPDIPMLCVCGNHDLDLPPTPKAIVRYRDNFGDDFYSFWVGGCMFIVYNVQYYWHNPPQTRGLIDNYVEEQKKWLDAQLQHAKEKNAKHIIMFQHVPWFLEAHDEPYDFMFNIEPVFRTEMLTKLKAAGVRTVFCGHYHRNAGGFDDDLEVVVTSAIGQPLGKDPHGFRVVKVYSDKVQHKYCILDDFTPGEIQL